VRINSVRNEVSIRHNLILHYTCSKLAVTILVDYNQVCESTICEGACCLVMCHSLLGESNYLFSWSRGFDSLCAELSLKLIHKRYTAVPFKAADCR
jgi:hypothetical protein